MPKERPEAVPEISPQMVDLALKALETKGLIYHEGGEFYIPTEKGWKLLAEVKPRREEIEAYGHSKIRCIDTKAIGITKSENLGKDENCFIAVKANKGCKDCSKAFIEAIKQASKIEITIEADNITEKIIAYGSPALRLTHDEEMIIRKDDYIDSRTMAIMADKAANDIKQELVEKLRNPEQKVKIIFEIK